VRFDRPGVDAKFAAVGLERFDPPRGAFIPPEKERETAR